MNTTRKPVAIIEGLVWVLLVALTVVMISVASRFRHLPETPAFQLLFGNAVTTPINIVDQQHSQLEKPITSAAVAPVATRFSEKDTEPFSTGSESVNSQPNRTLAQIQHDTLYHEEANIRIQSLQVLALSRDEESIETLIQAGYDRDPDIRHQAIGHLAITLHDGLDRDARITDVLLRATSDDDERVRSLAVNALK